VNSAAEATFADWIGRRSEAEDVVTPRLAESFRAIFGDRLAPVGDGEAPLGLHWCLSPAIASMEVLGPDGHPAKNRDLPPLPLPRRMSAGGSIETVEPLKIGDTVRRISTIADIKHRQGRSGELWFVTINHEYLTPRGIAIREGYDIVYREAATRGREPPAPETEKEPAARSRPGEWLVETSSVLLFRYSAITFNGHRIHYDEPYAREVEGYPGLVVHGPIQATLLLNFAAYALGHAPSRFRYRGVQPAFAGSPLRVGRVAERSNLLRTESLAGTVHMEAAIEEPKPGGAA
jgi:3-methylfumaryl-CoA hydratase